MTQPVLNPQYQRRMPLPWNPGESRESYDQRNEAWLAGQPPMYLSPVPMVSQADAPDVEEPSRPWQGQEREREYLTREQRIARMVARIEEEREARLIVAGGAQAEADFLDLTPYLDGTFVAPQPSVGLRRVDGANLLYPGRWHTAIGPTAAGKSWFGVACVAEEIRAGRNVVYVHFEEAQPTGTIERLLAVGLTVAQVRDHLSWVQGRLTAESATRLAEDAEPSLVVLDGILAACSAYGWDPVSPMGVGAYRGLLVTPFVGRGAAVLSLGHPPKGVDRQSERDGFGSVSWLAEVDGVGFRLKASSSSPIARGKAGYASVDSVKDRYGLVEALGERTSSSDGWVALGTLRVDNSGTGRTLISMAPPGPLSDPIDALAEKVVSYLKTVPGARFASQNKLEEGLTANEVRFGKSNLTKALGRLRKDDRLIWPEVPERQSRPGWLAMTELSAPMILIQGDAP